MQKILQRQYNAYPRVSLTDVAAEYAREIAGYGICLLNNGLNERGEVKMTTKVLLVDDEHLILYSLSKTLKHSGADVTAVTNGKDALHEVGQCSYDICFLDVHLPDANGLDLMKTIREMSPHTAIIIMTATYLSEKQIRSLHNKGCYFLPKPFDLEHVLAMVGEISGRQNAAAGGA